MSEEENIPKENTKEQISNSKEENVNENISPQQPNKQSETSDVITSEIKQWKYIITRT